jgi:AraC family transcriptional regulator
MKIGIVEMPELRVVALRHRGAYNRIGDAFAKLGTIAGPSGLFGRQAIMIAVYHDDPRTTPEAELRSNAGCTIAEGVSIPEGLIEVRVPAGRYAMAQHVGPYATLPATWATLSREWLPASGHRRGPGMSYELYDHPDHKGPDELITDVYIPLA